MYKPGIWCEMYDRYRGIKVACALPTQEFRVQFPVRGTFFSFFFVLRSISFNLHSVAASPAASKYTVTLVKSTKDFIKLEFDASLYESHCGLEVTFASPTIESRVRFPARLFILIEVFESCQPKCQAGSSLRQATQLLGRPLRKN